MMTAVSRKVIWLSTVPPPVTRQKYVATFKVVELRQVFYQTPLVSTIQKWCVEVPLDFKYTMQA